MIAALVVLSLVTGCDTLSTGADVLPQGPAERATLEVLVLGPDGGPVDGAWVVAGPDGRDARTDTSGIATLLALPAGERTVTARGLGLLGSGPVSVAVPDAGLASVTVQLESADLGALGVTAHDPTGAPVQGASVSVDGLDLGVTDGLGVASARGLTPGTVELLVTPPAGSALLPFVSTLDLTPGATSPVAFTFAARPPDGAGHGGSLLCVQCHATEHVRWSASAHGQARRSAGRLEQDGPAALLGSFVSGEIVSLESAAAGAEVVLGRTAFGQWTAEVRQGALSTGALRVSDVYGGHRAGFAFAVEHQGTRRVLPLGWSLGPSDPVGADPSPGWVVAWTDGWFAGGTLAAASPGAETSFDLRCAGCHAFGYAIEQGTDGFSLVAAGDAPAPERSVGCEACHGAAADHAAATADRESLVHQPGRQPARLRTAACARCHQRTDGDVHPLSAEPGLPLDGMAEPPRPWDDLDDFGVPAPDAFAVGASRVHRDQVRALLDSPHLGDRSGDCADCHDPHGSAHPADLHAEPDDDGLCVGCHRARFPDPAAVDLHRAHPPGTAVSCVDCHMAPSGLVLRRDALSGVGETRDHGLQPWTPDDVLAVFDAAGVGTLPVGDVPVTGCVHCHLREQARAADAGETCDCPAGDPGLRATWVAQQAVHAAWLEASQ